MSFIENWIIAECNSTLFIGLAIMVYELIYHNLQIRVRVSVRVGDFQPAFRDEKFWKRGDATIQAWNLTNKPGENFSIFFV